jgi:hypothetical protein
MKESPAGPGLIGGDFHDTSTGSASVSATGSLSRLNRSGLCLSRWRARMHWQGWFQPVPSLGRPLYFSGEDRRTIRSSPSRTRPAATLESRITGPVIAPQTTSTVSRRCSFSQFLPGPQAVP